MHFEFAYFSFFLVSYSFEIETTNTFTHSLRGGTYLYNLCKGAPAAEDTRGHGVKRSSFCVHFTPSETFDTSHVSWASVK